MPAATVQESGVVDVGRRVATVRVLTGQDTVFPTVLAKSIGF